MTVKLAANPIGQLIEVFVNHLSSLPLKEVLKRVTMPESYFAKSQL
jgi:hypothetical protein